MLVLRLWLRLCQKSSSVKRQNVSTIVSARYKPPCLRRLCSSVKVLALAIAIALVLMSLVWSRLYDYSRLRLYWVYGFDQQGWYGMFVACGIWCLADVSSVSPSSEQTGELWANQCLNLRNLPTPWEQWNSKKERTETNFQTRDLSSQRNQWTIFICLIPNIFLTN